MRTSIPTPSSPGAHPAGSRQGRWNGLTLLALALAALPLLASAACGGGGPAPEVVAEGKGLFLKTCASCHGPDAKGMPNQGKGLLDNVFVQQRGEMELVDFLKTGRPAWDPLNTTRVDMPPRGGNPALTDEDLRKIAVFVKSLQP